MRSGTRGFEVTVRRDQRELLAEEFATVGRSSHANEYLKLTIPKSPKKVPHGHDLDIFYFSGLGIQRDHNLPF